MALVAPLKFDATAGAAKIVRIPTTDDVQLNQLGIGTAPAAPIHILNNSSAGLRLERTAATARIWDVFLSAAGSFTIHDAGASTSRFVISPAGGPMSLRSGSNTGVVAEIRGETGQTADLLQFQTSAGAVLTTITSGGRIGIGTSNATAICHIAQLATGTGTPDPILKTVGGAHTGLTNAQVIDHDFGNTPRTVTFLGGLATSFAEQATTIFRAQTYGATTPTLTITQSATVLITGAPIAGSTNVVLSERFSLWTQSGSVRHDESFAGSAVNVRTVDVFASLQSGTHTAGLNGLEVQTEILGASVVGVGGTAIGIFGAVKHHSTGAVNDSIGLVGLVELETTGVKGTVTTASGVAGNVSYNLNDLPTAGLIVDAQALDADSPTGTSETGVAGTSRRITRRRGLLARNQGAAGITDAIGVDIEAQSGASGLNVGIRCGADARFEFTSTTALQVGNTGFAAVAFTVDTAVGRVDIAQALLLSGDISPAALAVSQNDYNPASLSTSSVIRQDASAAVNITGLQGGADGRVIQIINISTIAANTITLTHEDVASAIANRFNFRSASNILIPARGSVTLIYDSTSSRWRARSESVDTAPSDAAYLTNGAVAGLSNEVNIQGYTAPLFFQNAADSTTSFEVRNLAGLAMLRVDTTNGQLLGPDGAVLPFAVAGIGFRADPDVGLYRAGPDSLGLMAGVSRLVLDTAATWTVTHASADGSAASTAAYGFSGQVNTGMYRVAGPPEALGWSLAGSEKMRLSGTGLGVGVVASDTLSLKTHAAFADSEASWRTGGVSTTGAVTASIVSKTLSADSLWTFIVRVQARRTDAGFVTDGKSFVRKFAARKVGAGAPTVSTVDTLGTDQTFGTTVAAVNIIVSGDAIVVQADTTGAAAAQVLVWTATMEYQPAIGSA